MKIKFSLLISLALLSFSVTAQWTTRANFPGTARAKATSFAINDKIYVLGGITNSSLILADFWEYDITTNTWTQKPNFPGPERYGAVSFVLGNTGYIATGGNDNGHLDDMWQYDPATSQWIQRTGLPASQAQHENQRAEAYSFVINNKAYIGGGNGWVFGANSTNNIAFTDLWEYNPATNSWTSKSNLPDAGKNMAIAQAINGKAYVGLGCNVDQTLNHKSLWEYDPATDNWTSKADFPTDFTTDAGSFTLDSALYVVGGVNLNPVGLSNQVYKYDVGSNTWTALPNFNGGAIAGEFSVSTGTRAFVGGGYTGSISARNDVWEFTSATTAINENIIHVKDGVIIYPNPSSEFINLKSVKEITIVEGFDVSGKKVFSCNNDYQNIDINSLSPGIYNLRYTFNDGKTGSNRFVKN